MASGKKRTGKHRLRIGRWQRKRMKDRERTWRKEDVDVGSETEKWRGWLYGPNRKKRAQNRWWRRIEGKRGKRPMLWQRKKSRRALNQGRERRVNKVFGLRKREERRKKWKTKLKSKSKSPRSVPIKFTKDTKNRVWKPDGT